MGISDTAAATVESEPNRIYARLAVVLVTTTVSPPPDSGTFADRALTETLTVPVGRKGLTEPSGMVIFLCRQYQPICSTITARLYAAFVAVGTVVGLVVVSDGAQKPPIQYHD
jgi:hypothetical protein